MHKTLWGTFTGMLVIVGGTAGTLAARHQDVYIPGAVLGSVPVGGLTPEEATEKVRLWWKEQSQLQANFSSKKLSKLPSSVSWEAAGVLLEIEESLRQVPIESFGSSIGRQIGLGQVPPSSYSMVFQSDDRLAPTLSKWVESQNKNFVPAKVTVVKGVIKRTLESDRLSLDKAVLAEAVLSAYKAGKAIEIPLSIAPKKIPDVELNKIRQTMASYRTTFSSGNRPRSANIRLATSTISGHILMPGQKFSFNGVVGERTVKRGYKVAGVFVNGRLDEGVGGGICQVSTTLYNAALLAGLSVLQRRNHSLAVPYVAIGRDCAVSYGTLDLVLQNPFKHPIALYGEVVGNKVSFSVLGLKEPGVEFSVERGGLKSWSRGETVKHDPSLPYGKVVVVDKGGTAHRTQTYRIKKVNGKVVARENLGESYYPGSPRLLSKNKTAKKPNAPAPAPAGPVPLEAPNELEP